MENSGVSIADLHADQKKFFATGATLPFGYRIAALRRLEQSLMDHEQGILDALEVDLGKPGLEAYLAEYYFLLSELRLICKRLKRWLKPERVSSPVFIQPARSKVVYKPFGSLLIIAPWNYPFQLAFAPLIAAIAAGNTVVLKPSELTPGCADLIAEIVEECFLPEYVSVVKGDAEVASSLLGHRWDFIFYTGSERVGKIVSKAAAKHLTPTILELGGKCPCVVDEGVDVEKTAERILTGKFFNGGQTCFAPDYLVVHEKVREQMLAALTGALSELPWEESLTHLVNKGAYERVSRLIPDGARNVIKSGEDDFDRLHLAPRIITDVSWDDAIMQEEIFGPLLPVVTFEDHGELLERINSLASPLAIYFFSRNKSEQERWITHADAGNFCINDTMKQGMNLNLPFGGVGSSGHGRYRGVHGVKAMSYSSSVTRRYFIQDIFAILPPYGDRLRWMRKFMR